jgi:hypothetical protein
MLLICCQHSELRQGRPVPTRRLTGATLGGHPPCIPMADGSGSWHTQERRRELTENPGSSTPSRWQFIDPASGDLGRGHATLPHGVNLPDAWQYVWCSSTPRDLTPAGCGGLWRRSSPVGDSERGLDARSRRRVGRLRWPELHAREEGARGRQRRGALATCVARRPRRGGADSSLNQPGVCHIFASSTRSSGEERPALCSHRERRGDKWARDILRKLNR